MNFPITYNDPRELEADFREHFEDYITAKYEHWLMERLCYRSVEEFVDWLKREAKRELNVKRGPDNLSFTEVKEKYRKNSS